jgi:hypothetical protein
VCEEKIYIIHLSDDGSPIKTTAEKIVKPSKLPAEWKPSIRLWTHMTEGLNSNYFFVFGIDSLLNFYWESFSIE